MRAGVWYNNTNSYDQIMSSRTFTITRTAGVERKSHLFANSAAQTNYFMSYQHFPVHVVQMRNTNRQIAYVQAKIRSAAEP